MTSIPDASVDMVLCDLPYGVTRNRWDVVIPLDRMWEQYKRICKGAIVLTATQPFASQLIMSNPRWYRYEWVWQKDNCTGFLDAKRRPLRIHEQVLVFSKSAPPYHPQMRTGFKRYTAKRGASPTPNYNAHKASVTVNNGERYPVTILDVPTERGLHPTQKPVALMEYLIRTYTQSGDVVLDNCMGSGTTGVAAANTGRRFIGVERDQKYYAIAAERIEQAWQAASANHQPLESPKAIPVTDPSPSSQTSQACQGAPASLTELQNVSGNESSLLSMT